MGAFFNDRKQAAAPSPFSPSQATVPPRTDAQFAAQSATLALPGTLVGSGTTAALQGLFGTMFGAGRAKSGDELMCKAPTPTKSGDELMCKAPVKSGMDLMCKAEDKPKTGLGSYQVVPDDFVGPLQPNQLRQSQYDDLKKYDFDQFKVVGPDFKGKLDKEQMTQEQFEKLTQAWINIQGGTGMKITGDVKEQETFRRMMRDSMGDSPTMRNLISDIGNDTDNKHTVEAKVGRSQPGVFVDSFASNEIDLNDIEQFQKAPRQGHENEATQGEQLAHFLSERRAALTSADPSDFEAAHQKGTDTHNAYRTERGQSEETSATGYRKNGKEYVVFKYKDGTQHEMELDNKNDISRMIPP